MLKASVTVDVGGGQPAAGGNGSGGRQPLVVGNRGVVDGSDVDGDRADVRLASIAQDLEGQKRLAVCVRVGRVREGARQRIGERRRAVGARQDAEEEEGSGRRRRGEDSGSRCVLEDRQRSVVRVRYRFEDLCRPSKGSGRTRAAGQTFRTCFSTFNLNVQLPAVPHTCRAVLATSSSLRHWSSMVRRLPAAIDAKPHCGLSARCSSGT